MVCSQQLGVRFWQEEYLSADDIGPSTRFIELENIICYAVKLEVMVGDTMCWATIPVKLVREIQYT